MQTINLEAIDLLTLQQIETCLIDVAQTVLHCADNRIPVDDVISMVRSSLHAQMEEALRASLRQWEQKRASLPAPAGINPHTPNPPPYLPPWAVANEEKPRTKYQTQARKSL